MDVVRNKMPSIKPGLTRKKNLIKINSTNFANIMTEAK